MTIADLIDSEIAFMGSDWREDPSVTDGPLPGYRWVGEKPCINCNDVFFWGAADAEEISEELLPELMAAVDECGGDLIIGADLYCARRRGERPQGAYYSYVPRELWHLFDACGPEKATGFGNPYRPGEYQREPIPATASAFPLSCA